jgi:hypothetical protein
MPGIAFPKFSCLQSLVHDDVANPQLARGGRLLKTPYCPTAGAEYLLDSNCFFRRWLDLNNQLSHGREKQLRDANEVADYDA